MTILFLKNLEKYWCLQEPYSFCPPFLVTPHHGVKAGGGLRAFVAASKAAAIRSIVVSPKGRDLEAAKLQHCSK